MGQHCPDNPLLHPVTSLPPGKEVGTLQGKKDYELLVSLVIKIPQGSYVTKYEERFLGMNCGDA